MSMNRRKHGSIWIRIVGVLVLLLGFIHVAATATVYSLGFNTLSNGNNYVFLFMYVSTGLACIGTGLLVVFGSFGLARARKWARITTAGAAVFVLLLGITAPFAMSDNPFAYAILAVAVLLIIPLIIYRKDFSERCLN